MGIAHPSRDDAAGRVGGRLVDESGHRRGQQVDLDVLTAPRLGALVEGREDADQPVQAGHHVEHGDPGAVRRTSAAPVRLIKPETAWTMRSYPGSHALPTRRTR